MMENEKKIDILFTGLIRKPEMFKKSILEMIGLREKGLINEIKFSTWLGEVQKYPDIYSFFKKNKIKIIESEEPKIRGSGNIWCQMKSLEAGLNKVDPGRFVLKTRSDVYVNPEFIKKIAINKNKLLMIKKPLPKGNIFKYKIWVPFFDLKTPFYMADECFFGHRDDLKHLYHYDNSYYTDFKIGGGRGHIMRFIHPFRKDYPVLTVFLGKYANDPFFKALVEKERNLQDKYYGIYVMLLFKGGFRGFLRKFKILKYLNKKMKLRKFKRRLRSQDFIDCLTAYYSILYSHFYIEGDSMKDLTLFTTANKPQFQLNNNNIDKNFEEYNLDKFSSQVYVYNMKLLDNLINKNIERTKFTDKLINAIDKFNLIKISTQKNNH